MDGDGEGALVVVVVNGWEDGGVGFRDLSSEGGWVEVLVLVLMAFSGIGLEGWLSVLSL